MITRYEPVCSPQDEDECTAEMSEWPTGDYMLFADHEAEIERRVKEARELALEEAVNICILLDTPAGTLLASRILKLKASGK